MNVSISAGSASPSAVRRLVLYALSRPVDRVDDFVALALRAIRPHADRIVVMVPDGTGDAARHRLGDLCDAVRVTPSREFDPSAYAWAAQREQRRQSEFDEVVLTGDSWFGPVCDFAPVLERMSSVRASVWAMVENAHGLPEAFPLAGFPHRATPWLWTVVRPAAFASSTWGEFWSTRPSSSAPAAAETDFLAHVRGHGHVLAFAFPADRYPSPDPALYTSGLLLDDGCPMLARTAFTLYPPFLDRFAVIGRDILRDVQGRGFPLEPILQNLARTVAPKSLYAVGGMMEVLPESGDGYDASRPFRVAAVVHVSDLGGVDELLARLAYLPGPFDLFVTTTDGKRATQLQRLIEERDDHAVRRAEVRVTPASRGRDMSDFFVGCRDVLLGGEYDLVVKVHARSMRHKTLNVRRYFRRYQYQNLLNSPVYVQDLLAVFQREPGLGVVFPPMMHIGYSTMGRAWAGLRDRAAELASELGISVPLDEVSPLAPFGGMWVARPDALRLLSSRRWRYSDYGRRGAPRFGDLARLQERMVAYAAGELGYHSRTVLTREHASISHTALESKVDNLFSTTRGWPVEQIQLLQRAGYAGHGGAVALSRMYLRLNHPRVSRLLMPLYHIALRAFVALTPLRSGAGRLLTALGVRRPAGEDG